MFTGIVEDLGALAGLEPSPAGARMVVTHHLDGELAVGESVAVNGCCLTVTERRPGRFAADLMGETLQRTALGDLQVGAPLNLERALAADGRFGGHIVQGHVDGVGTVSVRTPHDAWTMVAITAPGHLAPYLVEKGSVTVDGVSLTVVSVRDGADGVTFEIGLIPHTLAVTTFGVRQPGDTVNLEVDVLAKYVERMLAGGMPTPYGP